MSARQRILLSDPWNATHTIECRVSSGAASDDPAVKQRLAGRGGLEFTLGEFTVTLRPNGAELRALAKAMLQVADELTAAAAAAELAQGIAS